MLIDSNTEILRLTAKEVLLTLFDVVAAPFFASSSIYRRSMNEYLKEREYDRSEFMQKIYYLKRMGYITTFSKSKEKFIELTPKGFNHYKKISIFKIKLSRSDEWDKKWRIVVFDVPKKYDDQRDIFREMLKRFGFLKIQASVYVYPFECTQQISELSSRLGIEECVTIMISEIFQGEETIVDEFIDRNILRKEDLLI